MQDPAPTYQFEVSDKSGLVDCFAVQAESLSTAWRAAERLTGAGAIRTAKVRNPSAFGDQLWHGLAEAQRLEHIARVAA